MTNRAGGNLIGPKSWWWNADEWGLANSEPVSSERRKEQMSGGYLSHMIGDLGTKPSSSSEFLELLSFCSAFPCLPHKRIDLQDHLQAWWFTRRAWRLRKLWLQFITGKGDRLKFVKEEVHELKSRRNQAQASRYHLLVESHDVPKSPSMDVWHRVCYQPGKLAGALVFSLVTGGHSHRHSVPMWLISDTQTPLPQSKNRYSS